MYGKVKSKYIDTSFSGRDAMVIVIEDSIGNLKQFPLSNATMYDIVDTGDYVYKRPGTLKRYLLQKNDTITYYPQCGGVDVE